MKRVAGFSWFLIWISSGTYLLTRLLADYARLAEVLFPILIFGWCALLFIGHHFIDRIFKKST